jgi:hypothetical protein
MTAIALLGAGGKIGYRLTQRFSQTDYQMYYLEVSPEAIEALHQLGLETTPHEEALPLVDVAVLAVPDHLIGQIATDVVPLMKSGAMVICLDAAAPYAGQLPAREDISYFLVHPCHPPIYNDETDAEARADHFGGDKAKQHIVCALMQGPESAYPIGETLARIMFGPVMKAHRVTVEQMALLEPGLVESVSATCLTVVHEALQEVIRQGVPAEAAHDFLMGHINVTIAMLFGYIGAEMSDGAKLAIRRAKQAMFRPDWMNIIDRDTVRSEAEAITRGAAAFRSE